MSGVGKEKVMSQVKTRHVIARHVIALKTRHVIALIAQLSYNGLVQSWPEITRHAKESPKTSMAEGTLPGFD